MTHGHRATRRQAYSPRMHELPSIGRLEIQIDRAAARLPAGLPDPDLAVDLGVGASRGEDRRPSEAPDNEAPHAPLSRVGASRRPDRDCTESDLAWAFERVVALLLESLPAPTELGDTGWLLTAYIEGLLGITDDDPHDLTAARIARRERVAAWLAARPTAPV